MLRTVLVEGDSTAYGNNDDLQGGWANRLKTEATRAASVVLGHYTVVHNMARPGMRLGGVLRWYKEDLTRYAADPTTSTLSSGLNEAKVIPGDARPRISPAQFANQLLQYCEISAEFAAKPVLMGLHPIDERRTLPVPRMGVYIEAGRLEEYDNVIREVAHATQSP